MNNKDLIDLGLGFLLEGFIDGGNLLFKFGFGGSGGGVNNGTWSHGLEGLGISLGGRG
ncbi:hypothetical protein TSUD_319680 [Trifolium subterraneum]|uniref:Uncharacterized protein n=1 Tax=Trifolium subterraneum TaxID=3900 RepID=A0A2Z6N9D1_TRISU|nr:hypothetical protein TSUD_319680 [Trifolium subterraneum]